MKNVFSVCLSSTLQRTVTFKKFAAGCVNRSIKYRMDASGKAVNATRVLEQLEKGCAEVLCPLGINNAERFMELARRDGIIVHNVMITGNTRECWTLLDENTGTTTELVVNEPAIDCDLSAQTEEIIKTAKAQLQEGKALLIAGSRPKIWPDDIYALICKIAHEMGSIVMVDFWGEDLKRTLQVCAPNIIKINEEEFCGTFGTVFPMTDGELKTKLCNLSKELNNILVVTRGTKATFAADKGVFFATGIEKVHAINTTACGDSFSAGFLYEYLHSGSVENALLRGTWCAARNAQSECPGSITK